MEMKKIITALFSLTLLIGNVLTVKAQYGVVHYDASVNFNGSNTANLTTTHCKELILISYDGWPGPGTGPVTVDGNNATQIAQAYINWGTSPIIYGYIAPNAGVHNIVCTETGYFYPPYGLNLAASFYVTGSCNPISIPSITHSQNLISCVTGGPVTANITTTLPGAMIYGDFDNNNGQSGPITDSWTSVPAGITFINSQHQGNGIDASDAYQPAATPGTYTVTATNNAGPNNGCGGLGLILLNIPPPLAGNCGGNMTVTPSVTPPTCGLSNGSICVTANGGTPPYTYTWSPPVSTTNCATGLSAGTYSITISDNACHDTTFVYTFPANALNLTATINANEKCFGQCIGSGSVSANGGTPPYTYNWAPLGGNGPSASNLCAGVYTVTVTDKTGCNYTVNVNITQPAALVLAPTVTDPLCYGVGTGTINSNPTGGTPAYNYSWTPNVSNGANATGLSVGTYTVDVSDANGCSTSSAIAITQPAQLVPFMGFPVPVSCFGGSNGSIACSATGGTKPYAFQWSPTGGNNYQANGLTAGTYTVTITDANNCTATASIAITQPLAPLAVTLVNPTEVACNGDSTGSATASVTGGTQNYTYSWTPGGQTDVTATGLSAGIYTCLVTDAFGCTANASIQLSEPTAIILNTLGTPTTCYGGSDGQANVIPLPGGGVPPYTYSWSNNATTPAITGLTAGVYTITVLDSHGCISVANVAVTQPPAIVVAFSADTLKGCAPLCTDFIDVSSDPNNYAINSWSWDFGDGSTDNVASPRHCFTASGLYSVTLTVVDSKGCTNNLTIPNMIDAYSQPVPSFVMSPQPTTILNPDIQFSDKSTDVYGPIASWEWNFNDPASQGVNDHSSMQNPMHKYLDTGTYCVNLTVTNIRGCRDSITECVVISNNYTLWIPSAFTPNGDGRDDIFLPKGEAIQKFSMYIFDRWGTMIYYTDDPNKGWDGTVNGSGKICPEDTYVYEISVTDNFNGTHSYIGKVTLIK